MVEYLKTRAGRKMIRDKLEEVSEELSIMKDELSLLLRRKRASPMAEWWYQDLVITKVREKIKQCEREVRRWKMYDSFSKGYGAKHERKLDKESAKQFPVEELIVTPVMGKSPGRLKFCCPLPEHTDSTPSFVVYKDSNSYYCFGCAEGGDSIDLYMKIHQCDFVTAVTSLIT